MKIKYYHGKKNVCHGNIIWAKRDKGDCYYRFSRYGMQAGKFPADHPCCPNDRFVGGTSDGQLGTSESIKQFRERGYWASCFPEGDGITLTALNEQSPEAVMTDIKECFGWDVERAN